MDTWERMIRDEAELTALFIQEEMRDMSELERKNVIELQDEAMGAYERVDTPGMQWQCMQAAMLAQIALELGKLNALLEQITKRVEES